MPTVTFRVLDGPDKGHVFRDLPTPVTIGREEGNLLRLNDERVSRYHAKVEFDNGEIILTDLGSTNGTRVNNTVVQIRRLKPGDRISIGRSQLLFGSPPAVPFAPSVRRLSAASLSAVELCDRLWEQLQTNHLLCDGAEKSGLLEDILDPETEVSRILSRGFHRLVVLDAAAGLDREGRFQIEAFLGSVRERVAAAFGLNIRGASFHLEDVFQVLKDEPRSLFCFTNFQHIPADQLGPVRGFTQGAHQALFLCRGHRDLAAEERALEADRSGEPDSVHADTVVRVDAAETVVRVDAADDHELSISAEVTQHEGALFLGNKPVPPHPQRMNPSQAARLAELLDFLHRYLTAATVNVRADDDAGQVTLNYAEWQGVVAVQTLLARYVLAIDEPGVPEV
ncbi:MAG TPA: FHA domain-containing protein [Gemmataceae bacterium]|nr:FHA domain-containing protein [Gemmataceae bacterium]